MKVRRHSVTIPVSKEVAQDLTVILADLFLGTDLSVCIDTEKGLVTIERKKAQVPYDA